MNKFGVTKEKIIIFGLSIVFALLVSNNVFHIQDILTVSAPILLGIVLAIIIGYLTFQAGLVVIKSLVFVAAELSLILFLAQSYCATGVIRTESSDQALISLIIMGLSYVAYRFLSDAYTELKALGKRFKEVDGRWSREAIIMFVSLLLFVGLFVVVILQVLTPTVLSLCVYK